MKLNGSLSAQPFAASLASSAPPDSGGRGRFVFVREHGGRAEEVNDFYNRFTGKSRSLDAHRWEFLDGPAGPSLVWTITQGDKGDIVGHHAVVPTPLVQRGQLLAAGRTENTIIDPAVRTKIFYPGMEKRALAETLQNLRIVYTIHSTGPGRLRERLGYSSVGRWVLYVPKAGPGYLGALFRRGCKTLRVPAPDALIGAGANVVSWLQALARRIRRPPALQATEIGSILDIGTEYEAFWARARARYDVTIDRSLAFLRWRFSENPHLRFRTWTLRRDGQLRAVIVAHRHALGEAWALYVDDIIVGDYDDGAFDETVASLPRLDPTADALVLMTLAVDTPLHRVLQRRFPLQTYLLRRFGARLLDEMLAVDREGVATRDPWYVTAIFTEGMDTSRETL
jgi:hypothetical protein